MPNTAIGKAYVQIIPSADGISGAIADTLQPAAEKAGKQAGETINKSIQGKLKNLGKSLSSVGDKMTKSLTVPIAGALTASANLASDYEENMNKIDVAFGNSAQAVKDWANNARTEFGLSKVAASDAVSAFGALGKGIGLGETEAATMSTTLAGLSADLASYFNTSNADAAKALEGIFTGESEALKRFGVVMLDTNLEKFAADQGLVWKEMSQAEKTTLRYQYVLSKTKDAQGDYSRTSDGTANSIKTFKAAVEDLGVAVGTQLLPLITPLIQKITGWVQKFADLSPATQKVITIVGIAVAAIGPLLSVIGRVATGVQALMTILPMLTGPVGIVIAAVAAAVAVGVALYKNWDKIKKAAGVLRQVIANQFKRIKNAIVQPIQAAKDAVKKIIEKIKSFFKFDFKLPHIKLPHFVIDPPGWKLGDLLSGSIPSLGIDWYAKGGIMTKPTIFGGGEAGAEGIIPLTPFWDRMDAMADSIVNGVATVAAAGSGAYGDTHLTVYLYPNGPKMMEETVKAYDKGKKILG